MPCIDSQAEVANKFGHMT